MMEKSSMLMESIFSLMKSPYSPIKSYLYLYLFQSAIKSMVLVRNSKQKFNGCSRW